MFYHRLATKVFIPEASLMMKGGYGQTVTNCGALDDASHVPQL